MPNTPTMTYHVTAEIQDDSHALIKTRGHELTLNVKKGSGEAGFNAAETLLGHGHEYARQWACPARRAGD